MRKHSGNSALIVFQNCHNFTLRTFFFAENKIRSKDMEEQTKKDIYEILEQAKVLEELMKELELPLSENQLSNLKVEEFHINTALCNADYIHDVVSRIDSALHSPEEYPEPEPIPPYDGNAESVYNRLCGIRDDWKSLYYSDTFDKRKRQFLIANRYFAQWTAEMFQYTEYLGTKYGLMPSLVRIGGMSMVDLGAYYDKNGSISYNRRLIRDPEHALITVIHELCHVRCPNHSNEFWQLYEDICISEGILMERVLGDRKSLRELKTDKIPYRWKPTVDYFTDNEKITIEKIIKMTTYTNKSFME